MIILSDCIGKTPDEGCIKVANSLTERIKTSHPEVMVVSYGDGHGETDVLNALFLNPSLKKLLREKDQPLLYIPFASNTLASTIRLVVLSAWNRGRVTALFTLRHPMGKASRFFLRYSRANIVVLSGESCSFFREQTDCSVTYLKMGVDPRRFHPVSREEKRELRRKYGIPADKKVVLHVGHLNRGRNVMSLRHLSGDHLGLLALSTQTREQRDVQLRQQLEKNPNIRILDSYIPAIQQIYQLADVYLFPVVEKEACIDVPLSVLEAAACGIPVVCTAFGELQAFLGKQGFYYPPVRDFNSEAINRWVDHAISQKASPRESVEGYDWNLAIQKLWDGVNG